MSKKLFTLIHETEVIKVAPQTKIIPSEVYSKLADAQDLLDIIKVDADKYRAEVIQECETLKEQAQQEGYNAGLAQWAEKLVRLEEEIASVRKETEKLIIPVALKAAKKILGREIENVDTAVVDIVSTALKAVAQHKRFTIYVNRKDLDVIEANKARIKKVLEAPEAFSIRERSDVQQGGCIIETDAGIINAQLDNQWRILESAFERLALRKETAVER